MGFQPIARTVPQYVGIDGKPYSGAVLKAYKAGTTTVINMAGDADGTALDDGIALNSSGFPEISGNVVIPHLEEAYKLALFPSQSAADSDTGAIWTIDNLSVGLSFGETSLEIDSNTVLNQAAYANAHLEITGETTLTLPPIASVANAMIFTYRNAGTQVITFDANGAESINGEETVTIQAGGSGMFVAGDDSWSATGVDNIVSGNLNELLSGNLPETGDTCYSYRASKVGWVLATGQTIGNASSGAELRANADTFNLYELLWNSLDNSLLPIEDDTGSASTRGLSAQEDFDLGKRLPVPDERGRVSIGRDDMGGTAASRLSLSRPEGIDGTILGGSGGEQAHTQTEAELAPHAHGLSDESVQSGTGIDRVNGAGNEELTASTGGGEPMNNIQPGIVKNVFIKL